MARRIEYVGGGRIRDAKTLDLISPQKVVSEYNEMAARLEATENASDMARRTAPHSQIVGSNAGFKVGVSLVDCRGNPKLALGERQTITSRQR